MKAVALQSTSDSGPAREKPNAVAHPVPISPWPLQPVSVTDRQVVHRKASCACGGGCPGCQAKSSNLEVSEPHDPAEIEADQIADKVLRMPADKPVEVNHNSDKLNAKRDACERAPASGQSAPSFPGNFVRDLGAGQPLDAATRAFMEPRFGHDFSHVRVHTDARAVESAQAVNALAYTVGHDVVFGVVSTLPRPKTAGVCSHMS